MLPIPIDSVFAKTLTAKQRRRFQAESEGGLAPYCFEDWLECDLPNSNFVRCAEYMMKMAGEVSGESGDLGVDNDEGGAADDDDDINGGADDDDINGGGGALNHENDGAQPLLAPVPPE